LVEAGKSKLQGGSMATFPVVPHLITVFNFGGVKIPLDMLQTNELDVVNDKYRLLASTT